MNLTALESLEGETVVHGVEVDRLGAFPPRGLMEVSFRASSEADGGLASDVLDTLILYRQCGVRVLLELPFGVTLPVLSTVRTCANIGVDLALLPPTTAVLVEWDQYRREVVDYARAWLGLTSTQNSLLPVSSYLQYVFGEIVGNRVSSGPLTTDPYLHRQFVDGLPPEQIAATKTALDAVFLEHFGSREEMRRFIMTVGAEAFRYIDTLSKSTRPLGASGGPAE